MMKPFTSFLVLEFKRIWTVRNIIVMSLFFILSMSLTYVGIQQYKEIQNNAKEFQAIEEKKVEKFNNWDQYGGYGIRLYFMPSPISIYFNNTNIFTELSAHLDVGEKLNIYDSFKGKKVFARKPGRWLDLSGIILLFGSLMALVYGYDAFRHKEYLKFLASMYGRRRVYFSIWFFRIIFLSIYFTLILIGAIHLVRFMGIKLGTSGFISLSIFFLLLLLLLIFFFSIGSITATMKSRLKRLIIVLAWFLFVYLLPVIVNVAIEQKSKNMVSNYQAELTKFTTLMNFESDVINKIKADQTRIKDLHKSLDQNPELKKYRMLNDLKKRTEKEIETLKKDAKAKDITQRKIEALNNYIEWLLNEQNRIEKLKVFEKWSSAQAELKELRGKIKNIQQEMMKQYTEVEAKEIENLENDLVNKMKESTLLYQHLSLFLPSTFYLSTNNEISSRGYKNIIEFHRYSKYIKDEFFRFYRPRKLAEINAMREGKRVPEVKSFFEERDDLDNIFQGTSGLPGNFIIGLIITCFWVLGVSYLSYSFYRKSLFPLPDEEIKGIDDLEIEFKKEECHVLLSSEKTISDHLYNVLSGKNKRFHGKVDFEGTDLVERNRRSDFVYLCHPADIPKDIKVRAFIPFIIKTLKLSQNQSNTLKKKLNLEKIGEDHFGALKDDKKGDILFEAARLKGRDIYMFYDFAKGMPPAFVQEFLNKLNDLKINGAAILYLTNDLFLGRKLGDRMTLLKKDADLMAIKL